MSNNLGGNPQPSDGHGPTPWPVYGQEGQLPPSSSGPAPWPVYGAPPPEGNASNPYGPDSGANANPTGPYGAPSATPYGGAPTPPNYGPTPFPQSASAMPAPMGRRPTEPLPSRTGPVLTIIAGVALMVVIAPIVLISLVLSGFGIGNIVDSSMRAANGGTVVVDDTGAVGVALSSSDPYSCTLTSESGVVIEMTPEVDGAIVAARGLTPGGEYVLTCEGVTGAETLVVLDGHTMESMVPSSMRALGWASLVGVVGLGVMVGGIVWLVRRNRSRRDIMMTWRW